MEILFDKNIITFIELQNKFYEICKNENPEFKSLKEKWNLIKPDYTYIVFNDDPSYSHYRAYPYKNGKDFEEFNNYLISKLKEIQ